MPELGAVDIAVRVKAKIVGAVDIKNQYGPGYFTPTQVEYWVYEGDHPRGEFNGPKRKADGKLSDMVKGHHHFDDPDEIPEALRPIVAELLALVNRG